MLEFASGVITKRRGFRFFRTSIAWVIGVLGLVEPRIVGAGVNQWTPLGPYGPGGYVRTLAIDPSSASIVYVGTDSGVFKSVDAGASWVPESIGLVALPIYSLAIDPRTPTTIYAASAASSEPTLCGISRSMDGGASWSSRAEGLGGACPAVIAIDPRDSAKLYALAGVGPVTTTNVYVSTDAGSHWRVQGNIADSGVGAFVIDPITPSALYAAGGLGVVKSLDGGASWQQASVGLAGGYFNSLVLAPGSPGILYIASDAGAFWSDNGGALWQPLAGGLPPGSVTALAIDPSSPRTLYASLSSTFQSGRQNGIYRSTDAGATWQPWNQHIVGITANTLQVAPEAPHTLYLGTASTSALYSRTGDGDWQALNTPFSPLAVRAVAAGPDASVIYAAADQGFYKTMDAGVHWMRLSDLPGSANGALGLLVDSSSPSSFYMATYSGVFRSVDGGRSWTPSGLQDQVVFALVADRRAPSILYAGTLPQIGGVGAIRKTTDGGATWTEQIQIGFAYDYPISFSVDPSNSAVVFAGTYYGLILKSTDAGTSWRQVNQTFGAVDSIVIDPLATNRVAASTNGNVSPMGIPPGNVVLSEDGGETWSTAPGLPCCGVMGLVIDPITRDLYVSVGYGYQTYVSVDHGATWSPIGTPGGPSPSLLARPSAGFPTLYGIGSNGVESMAVLPSGPCMPDGTTLCLQASRFSVHVDWQRTPLGPSQPAAAVPVTSDSGYFWFFDAANVEVMVKVLDGTAVNGDYWVFYGALSNVEYTVTVIDTLTGESKVYANPRGTMASVADTAAFRGSNSSAAATSSQLLQPIAPASAEAAGACTPDPFTLCVNESRFRVQVAWQLTPLGPNYYAPAVPLTGDTGYFWFFDDTNIELVVKVIDGRPVNGHFWVFYGALSSVEYTITVTDTQTGIVKRYDNPRGQLASQADTEAF